MLAIEFIGGPLDGMHLDARDGIPRAMPWAILYPCGCLEFTEDVTARSPDPGHRNRRPDAYYPLDEERTTPQLVVYSLPPLAGGIDALPRELEVPDPLVTASVDANDHPRVVAGWHIGGSVANMPRVYMVPRWRAV